MPNPQVPQGTLNRLRASVVWPSFPSLNVTPPYLSKEGIRYARDGQSTLFLPTMTGAVTSKEPYMMITLSFGLLKTQALSQAYEDQLENDAGLGNGTVRPDVSQGLQPFDIINCAIETPGELSFAGDDARYPVTIRGYTLVNNALWNG